MEWIIPFALKHPWSPRSLIAETSSIAWQRFWELWMDFRRWSGYHGYLESKGRSKCEWLETLHSFWWTFRHRVQPGIDVYALQTNGSKWSPVDTSVCIKSGKMRYATPQNISIFTKRRAGAFCEAFSLSLQTHKHVNQPGNASVWIIRKPIA